ncbi:MAG: SDR family NAD(P)-dependent oxidoreductase [Alphaproteobacteria bacterium]|nr:SDR family NAD(P)-dependent oxidoreductase [Alphaproteobacteria bacterium]
MKSVVVTGASTGIGWGCVKVLIGAGFRVFGSVRKETDANRLKAEFGANFVPLLFDVTNVAAVKKGAEEVERLLGGETLSGLVNNAGIAVPGPLLFLDIDEFRQQLEVNLTGQLIVTQAFAPLLGADPSRKGAPGRIVNITSVGGRNANPFLGPYNTSKFGFEGFSEALRRELMIYGIDVVVVAPGAVATPIWDKADSVDVARYANTPYAKALAAVKDYMIASGRKGLPPERIGEAVKAALTLPKPKVHYTVTPDPFQNWMMLNFPKRFLDRLIAGRLGLTKSSA